VLVGRRNVRDADTHMGATDTSHENGAADPTAVRQTEFELQRLARFDREVGLELNPLFGEIHHIAWHDLRASTNLTAPVQSNAIQFPLVSHNSPDLFAEFVASDYY
jgi:hypothetical protein